MYDDDVHICIFMASLVLTAAYPHGNNVTTQYLILDENN